LLFGRFSSGLPRTADLGRLRFFAFHLPVHAGCSAAGARLESERVRVHVPNGLVQARALCCWWGIEPMPLSIRSKLSLAQLLALLPNEQVTVLFTKHGLYQPPEHQQLQWMTQVIPQLNEQQLGAVLEETLRMSGTLRAAYPGSKWHYDERMQDFELCAAIDGYRLEPSAMNGGSKSYTLVAAEPTLAGTVAVEDDLTTALNASNLPDTANILALLNNSATAFAHQPPDYNACLAEARAALETLGISIARVRGGAPAGWGQALLFLRQNGLITPEEEKGIAGVYGFVSFGAHQHVALTEQEMTRLGRSLIISVCYFLVKEHNG
jgi:hypothetical protein